MCEHHDHHDDHGHDHHLEAHRPHHEPVVLEIGGELGALVVHTGAGLLHEEIEISPAGADAERSHKDVLERVVGPRSLYAAVFDRMPAGTYTLWHGGEPCARQVAVVAGAVVELGLATAA
jgi:hypothetical protein